MPRAVSRSIIAADGRRLLRHWTACREIGARARLVIGDAYTIHRATKAAGHQAECELGRGAAALSVSPDSYSRDSGLSYSQESCWRRIGRQRVSAPLSAETERPQFHLPGSAAIPSTRNPWPCRTPKPQRPALGPRPPAWIGRAGRVSGAALRSVGIERGEVATPPTLLDVRLIGMSPSVFSLSGFERAEGVEYAQSWLVQRAD